MRLGVLLEVLLCSLLRQFSLSILIRARLSVLILEVLLVFYAQPSLSLLVLSSKQR